MIKKYTNKFLHSILAVVLLLLLLISFWNVDCTIEFRYNTDALSGKKATLYWDYGQGFSESRSSYKEVEGDTVTFPLKNYRSIKKIRFMPVRETGDSAQILSAEIKAGIFSIKEIPVEDMKTSLTEDSNVTVQEDSIEVSKTTSNEYNYIGLNKNAFKTWNVLSFLIEAVRVTLCCIILAYGALGLYMAAARRKIKTKWSNYAGIALVIGILAEYFLAVYLHWIIATAGFLALFWAAGKLGISWKTEKKPAAYVCLSLLVIYIYMTSQTPETEDIFFAAYLMQQGLLALLLIGFMKSEEEIENLVGKVKINILQISSLYLKVVFVYILFRFMKNTLLNGSCHIMTAVRNSALQIGFLNIFWMYLFILALYFLVGNGISNTIFTLISLVLLIGNYIKISYHDTLLTPMDFKQIPDMMRIAGSILNKKVQIALIAGVILLIILIVKFRHPILRYLKPHIHVAAGVVTCVIVICTTMDLQEKRYMDEYNIGYKWYVTEYVGEQTSGTYLYNMYNIVHIKDLAVKKPEDYTQEHAEELKQEFDNLDVSTVSDTKPNIICVMAESMFDIENIDALTFNQEIEPTVHQYMKSTLISPRFGGYTAAVEYEALTGHSLYFYREGTMPYTTYFTNEPVHSVASELNENGYKTYAFHPNTGDFYAREKAYEKMEFDKMYTIADMSLTEDELTGGGFCRDIPFAEKAIDIVESEDTPVFLFGVSIAAHYTSADHYDSTDITVEGDGLTDSDKHILEQTAAAYQESDEMIRMLIDYVDQCEEPTILYVFGDHLPPLPMYAKLNYVDDPVNKYGTVLIGYSNYKEINFPEYMTPNYLGPQMLIDAEVEHSSYWDYIYSLRDQYPVIQKEFISSDAEENLETYRFIQYDLMFGKKWLLAANQ